MKHLRAFWTSKQVAAFTDFVEPGGECEPASDRHSQVHDGRVSLTNMLLWPPSKLVVQMQFLANLHSILRSKLVFLMRDETIAIHGGYQPDPTTKAVAVPIYQTVAYAFDSADHGAALFNLEVEGFRYSRIANPTSAVLERRIAELEGGVGALAVSTGQAAAALLSRKSC